jgi:hypothetical protein
MITNISAAIAAATIEGEPFPPLPDAGVLLVSPDSCAGGPVSLDAAIVPLALSSA